MVYEYDTSQGRLIVTVEGEPAHITQTKDGHLLAYTRETLTVTSEWREHEDG